MQKLGRVEGESKRVLELNGSHPAVAGLRKLFESDAANPQLESYGRMLYDQALLAEGSKLKDPAGFARRLNELIARSLSSG